MVWNNSQYSMSYLSLLTGMRSWELLNGLATVGRAGGINGLLPDVLKCCGEPLLHGLAISSLCSNHMGGEVCSLRVERCSAGLCAQERKYVLL